MDMIKNRHKIPDDTLTALMKGMVIPALPLALNKERKLDERRQRALIRYYLDAGAGGIAVGVHTTQFAIRDSGIKMYEPLLEIAEEEFDRFAGEKGKQVIRVAGVIGRTRQALKEAGIASEAGFHAALLSLAAFRNSSNKEIIDHCRAVAEVMPLFGFYLQPAVGGRILDVDFWRQFSEIENVIAIKIAPFSRYQTLDVVRGVAESCRAEEIALYTGNDDSILIDLLSEYNIKVSGKIIRKRIVGGLLGHWAVWTRSAVKLLNDVQNGAFDKDSRGTLSLAHKITDCNSAFFDTANNFRGCIAGIHEVLRRQGLLRGLWLLDRNEKLSRGQKNEIDRVYSAYPEMNDDKFVAENIDRWLS
jgi:dihydrodipicolinate synthase/N-acetylneuraminate lyase